MASKFTLLAHFLLISATLVAPSSGLLVRTSHEKPQLQSAKHSALSNNWAGAVQNETNSIPLNAVTGTFTVPSVDGWSSGTGASAWVGVDGYTCGKALSTGVEFTVDDGYNAWYWWYSSPYTYPDTISISAGDTITASVTVLSPTSGEVTIENLTNGMSVSTTVFASGDGEGVCGQNAEWIVGLDLERDPGLANFGTLTFTDASASDASGQIYYPDLEVQTLDIMKNNVPITSVYIGGSDVSVTYVGV